MLFFPVSSSDKTPRLPPPRLSTLKTLCKALAFMWFPNDCGAPTDRSRTQPSPFLGTLGVAFLYLELLKRYIECRLHKLSICRADSCSQVYFTEETTPPSWSRGVRRHVALAMTSLARSIIMRGLQTSTIVACVLYCHTRYKLFLQGRH